MNRQIDMEHRLSRQIYSIGASAQAKLSQARVLLLGLGGVGAEIGTCTLIQVLESPNRKSFAAKNLVLMGVSKLDICDNSFVSQDTLSTNFLIQRGDVGKNIVDASLHELRSMSPSVQIGSYYSTESLCSLTLYTVRISHRIELMNCFLRSN